MARGGKREGAGRPAGATNKATADVRAAARDYGGEALDVLVAIMRSSDSPPAARIAAARELLDRAYGKPMQALDLSSSDASMSPPRTLSDFYASLPHAANTKSF